MTRRPEVALPTRRRLAFAPAAPMPNPLLHAAYVLLGLVLFPIYWILGAILGAPGMRVRWACFMAGLKLAFANGHAADAYHCIVYPLDSVRHFEMDFFWYRIRALRPGRMLDVSSPRLLPLLLLREDRRLEACLLNPDAGDLRRTRSMAAGLAVDDRCRFQSARIDGLSGGEGSFELVTCMSVLEHIVDDCGALRIMWDRVAPGGRLLLSVPCASSAIEEYTNVDEYGLLAPDADGFVFWQRYYDEARLRQLFEITGPPVSCGLFAERRSGTYDADVVEKRTNPFYPRWREPFATARGYARHDALATLPGMGVMAMEFAKPGVATA